MKRCHSNIYKEINETGYELKHATTHNQSVESN